MDQNERHEQAMTDEEREAFEVKESAGEGLEVIELEQAPLTDINFGF